MSAITFGTTFRLRVQPAIQRKRLEYFPGTLNLFFKALQ
jgi:hypothetical protein